MKLCSYTFLTIFTISTYSSTCGCEKSTSGTNIIKVTELKPFPKKGIKHKNRITPEVKKLPPPPPSTEEKTKEGKTNGTTAVNINTATVEQLCLLPGIGPKKAKLIIRAREKRKFTRPAHLLRVKGIGRKTLKKLLPFITVGEENNLKKKAKVINEAKTKKTVKIKSSSSE